MEDRKGYQMSFPPNVKYYFLSMAVFSSSSGRWCYAQMPAGKTAAQLPWQAQFLSFEAGEEYWVLSQ